MGKQYYTMENIKDESFCKYQVTIHFDMDDQFMSLVPAHRVLINDLIDKGTIDYYSVSMESRRCWMVMNASNKKEIENHLIKTPLYKYWTIEIDELFVYDAQSYRLPVLQLN